MGLHTLTQTEQTEHQTERHTENRTETDLEVDSHRALPILSLAHRRRTSVLLSAAALALLLCLGIGLATGLFASCRIGASGTNITPDSGLGSVVTDQEKIPCVPRATFTTTATHNSVQEGEGVQGLLHQQEGYQARPYPFPLSSTSSVPQYFQTSPEMWAGPTATGRAPFLAQRRVWEGEYVPNAPLQTQVSVKGGNIFEKMG